MFTLLLTPMRSGPEVGRSWQCLACSVSTGDFLLLLCASQQWQVFSAEHTEEWQCMAGINTDSLEARRGWPIPVPNFIHCR